MIAENKYIKSPLNYTGGKYKILSSILPFFPDNINTFIDLFGGGFNVGINVNAKKIIYNDHMTYLKEMFQFFKETKTALILENIKNRIVEFNLNNQNVEGYLNLRKKYNEHKNILDLFILTCFSFNHQIRFNNKHEFNSPFGKERSSFNPSIEQNLISFITNLKNKNIEFYSKDFSHLKNYKFKKNDFVYCDPPYLISNASYNDGKRGFKNWTQKEDDELLKLLDFLNSRNVKFLLSNVFIHKGLKNDYLIEWSNNYNVKFINKNYKNCNYHLKEKDLKTQEVIVYNY
jgi:DNA adenine methylase